MADSPLVELFGPKLLGKDGDLETLSALSDCDVVGLYFSAHWCPPCRGFTPRLAKEYERMKGEGKKIEIVFISSDKSKKEFESYFAEHPWIALEWQNRSGKDRISSKFGVRGIPMLVFLDKNGKILTKQGRAAVLQAPESYPWDGWVNPNQKQGVTCFCQIC